MRQLIYLIPLVMLTMAYPYGRQGDLAQPSFLTTGDDAMCISVTVDSTTPVLVYDSNSTGKWDREILLQNSSDEFDVFCSTSNTGFTASSGPRFLLPKNPTGFTTNGRYDIYCLTESGAPNIDVIGVIEFDQRD